MFQYLPFFKKRKNQFILHHFEYLSLTPEKFNHWLGSHSFPLAQEPVGCEQMALVLRHLGHLNSHISSFPMTPYIQHQNQSFSEIGGSKNEFSEKHHPTPIIDLQGTLVLEWWGKYWTVGLDCWSSFEEARAAIKDQALYACIEKSDRDPLKHQNHSVLADSIFIRVGSPTTEGTRSNFPLSLTLLKETTEWMDLFVNHIHKDLINQGLKHIPSREINCVRRPLV